MWPCRSVIVGMTVLPVRSTRVVPAGTNTSARRPAAMKRVPSTTNAAFSMTLPSPVISRAPSYTVTPWAFAAEYPIIRTNAADSSTRLVRIIASSLRFIHRCDSDFDSPSAPSLRFPSPREAAGRGGGAGGEVVKSVVDVRTPTPPRASALPRAAPPHRLAGGRVTRGAAPTQWTCLPAVGSSSPLSPQRAANALGRERQLAQPHAGQRRDGVADRAGDERQPILAGASRRIVGRD